MRSTHPPPKENNMKKTLIALAIAAVLSTIGTLIFKAVKDS